MNDWSYCLQPELQEGIKNGRFPACLACVDHITDEVIDRIVPNPEDIEHLVPFLSQRFQWADEFRRLCLPRPPAGTPPPFGMSTKGGKTKRKRSGSDESKSDRGDIEIDLELPSQGDRGTETRYSQPESGKKSSRAPSSDSRPSIPDSCDGDTEYCGIQYLYMVKSGQEVLPEQGLVPSTLVLTDQNAL